MADARFTDADPAPLALMAGDADDLTVISTLVQDAILPVTEIVYDGRHRQLALLLNRFRWEDADLARRDGRPYERVRAVLLVSDVRRVQSDGIDRTDKDLILELLTLTWQAGEDGTGLLLLQFAGDGTLAVEAECLNVELRDVTRPYIAPSRRAPQHPDS
ncbi:DUF2948 family protein [Paracoccus sp. P2]|uniref:DUF2948 family protein n=1 Tax=Paracoccus pantotrophus TaxID=82367 RepID=A0A1I5IQQ0_PARPN|nr:DUF2948 family protein [Paracoccus pantotrophus]MDF3855069.1 DUF2948 family protein [Paracoccus pantotrophus]QFG37252.1 DUF2948 family protein [Paracoccus pantotrophus]QLH14811.1 DUF2948 family protein [Paracoccus pantotrophus]RDD99763.1 DUF2948 family protein [Paracoccus pantotrophus]RKS52318.1 hypothetical protein BDE18_1640 [Paracoccus pantotrophus]